MLSSCPCTICWQDHLCSIVPSLLLCRRSVGCIYVPVKLLQSCPVLYDKNTGVGAHALLWGNLPTQGSDPRLCPLHWHAGSLPTSGTWEALPALMWACFRVLSSVPLTCLAFCQRDSLSCCSCTGGRGAGCCSSLLFSLKTRLVILCLLPLQERSSQLIGGVSLSDSWRGGCASLALVAEPSHSLVCCVVSVASRWVFRCRARTRYGAWAQELWCLGWLSVPTTRESLVP